LGAVKFLKFPFFDASTKFEAIPVEFSIGKKFSYLKTLIREESFALEDDNCGQKFS
jgi:hypothetical protein